MRDQMICTIPARGGSKRLPRKNVRELAGKPLIAYSIEAALETRLFDQVYVCTEDAEIARVATQFGANVPELVPGELCGDLVASHIPCQYVASRLAENGQIESLLCLQPSSPLRSAQDIRGAVDKFSKGPFDFVVSVTPVDPHDFHWAVVPGEEMYWRMFFGTQYLKERPLLPRVYRPNGSIKVARLSTLAATGNFFGERMGVIETPVERSVHVAIEFDLKLCETILKA
ncbi:MAG TPA: acylneuraminate cytidylyltransferase family protein [Candidatus Sulfotelmatobacter sp.]|nr:acylneuraminate cytidylyltransferase family protein [Candidatus Sulfotelmatobacter sp.]